MTKPADYLPKHCRHKSKDLGFVRVKGKTLYTGRWGSREAEAEYRRIIAQVVIPMQDARGAGLPPPASVPHGEYLVEDLVADYVVHLQDKWRDKPRELRNVRYALDELLELFAGTKVIAFTPQSLYAIQKHLIKRDACRHILEGEHKRKLLLTRRMINRWTAFIVRAFAWGVKAGGVPAPVWHGLLAVETVKSGDYGVRESKEPTPATLGQIKGVLPFASRIVGTMIRVQYLTGMRPGELVTMRRVDIEINGGAWRYRPVQHKNKHRGKPREVPLSPEGQRLLRPYMVRPLEAFLFDPREAEAEHHANQSAGRKQTVASSPSVPRTMGSEPASTDHARYSVESYGRAVSRTCKRAGIAPFTPYQLRHAAGEAMANSAGIEATSKALGHASTQMTEHYAHLSDSLALKGFAVLDAHADELARAARGPKTKKIPTASSDLTNRSRRRKRSTQAPGEVNRTGTE